MLCADVLVERFNNVKGAGLVALLNEGPGKKGLALLLYDAGNNDNLVLATVDADPAKKGQLTNLQVASLHGGITEKAWYRLIMTVDPATPAITGRVFAHSVPADPDSDLAGLIGALEYNPVILPPGVTSPGANGLIGTAINAVVNASVTNFTNDLRQCGSL